MTPYLPLQFECLVVFKNNGNIVWNYFVFEAEYAIKGLLPLPLLIYDSIAYPNDICVGKQ